MSKKMNDSLQPPNHSWYWNRTAFYIGLLVIGGMMCIDAFPQYTRLHGKFKEWIDPALDITGLWQGSWELFAPEPDHVNVRVGAFLYWEDGSRTEWFQPNWSEMSSWQKARAFREMSYYDNLWREGHAAAWEPFCDDLAKRESEDSILELQSIILFQDRDVIEAPTSENWRIAYSPPEYQRRTKLYTWFPHE